MNTKASVKTYKALVIKLTQAHFLAPVVTVSCDLL